ncbi:hypothetical protein ACO0LM_16245 [Undibacterium sp. Di26W]
MPATSNTDKNRRFHIGLLAGLFAGFAEVLADTKVQGKEKDESDMSLLCK